MKVCLVTVYSPREITGVGEIVANIGRGLEERGHGYVVLTKSSDVVGREDLNLAEIQYRKTRILGGLLLAIAAARWLLRKRKDIDLLHLHSVSWLTAVCALMGSILNIPRLLTLHGKFPVSSSAFSNALFSLSQRLVIGGSNLVTCISEDTKQHYGLNSAVVIHNGVDTSKFRPDNEGRERKRMELKLGNSFVLLFIGRLDVNKGIRELIEVVGSLAPDSPNLRLLLVGTGEDELVRRWISEHKLEEHATMVGQVENAAPYYRSADLFILFSAFEGVPLTLLEAMASGLPCLATSVGGIPEIVTDGADGYLVQAGDKKGLSAAIVHIMNSEGEASAISAEARKTVENRFDLSSMVEKYLGVYGSLVKS